MYDNIKEDLQSLIDYFKRFETVEDVENTAQHKVRSYIKDNLIDFGLDNRESNKLAVVMDININEQLYETYYEQIVTLAYQMSKMAYLHLTTLEKHFGGEGGLSREEILDRVANEISLDISI